MRRGSSRRFVWLCVPMLLLAARFAPGTSGHTPVSRVTWTQDIGPLLQRRCVGCHRSNGFGPMSLETYDDARAAAEQIREEVQEGRMPPWPAVRGFGDHANDRSLTPLEVGLITAWTTGTTPLGPPMRAPEPDKARRPDLTLATPKDHATANRWVIATSGARERWISAWQFVPDSANANEAELAIESGSRIGSWVPPEGLVTLPAGVGVRLPAAARISVEIQHRRAADKSAGDRGGGTIHLYFTDRPARELKNRDLACGSNAIDGAIDVLSIRPAATEAGASVEAVALRSDGSIAPLSLLSRYQPGYRPTFRLRQPVDLPTGSRVDVKSSAPGCGARLEYAERTR